MKISEWFDWYDRLKKIVINKITNLPRHPSSQRFNKIIIK